MDLFREKSTVNLLPHGGEAYYHGSVFAPAEADGILQKLLQEIPWRNDETVMFGKHFVTSRKVAWVADSGLSYTYSGTTKQALPWTETLLHLKSIAEAVTDAAYNSCLLNLYHSGGEGMGWHSDDESSLVPGSSIAALSFGAERKFSFKHKRTKETVSLLLENGGLLDMRGETQSHWLHQLPKTTKVSEARVSLTFRRMKL